MNFNGYTPQTLAPILIAIAVVVAILYLIRVRRRRVTLPYIGLWREVMVKSSYRRWHDWLRRFISFLLWMAVVALIALALMDPRDEEDDTATRHAVIIIDSSASMMSVEQNSPCGSRFACAIADARELVDNMRAGDRVVVIEAGGIVSAVSGPFSSDKSFIDRTLRDMRPDDAATEIDKAILLANNLLKGKENAELYLFTDGQFENADVLSDLISRDIAFEQRTFGAPNGNLYIEAFNVRRYIANRLAFEVFFKVHNGFEHPVTARLRILGLSDNEQTLDASRDHEVLSEKMLTIASGSSELRLYENLTLGTSRMAATVELDSNEIVDSLPADNIAYARIPDFAKPDILCITPGNLFLEAALLLNENYRVKFVKPDDAAIREDGKIALGHLASSNDIVILDNSYNNLENVDTSDWQGRVIFINPSASDSPFKSSPVSSPVIERVNSRHQVARWLALKNLNISRARVFSGIRNDDMVMRAIEGPLMATKRTDSQRLLAIGFSLVESDLIFRVGLPVLFINAIDWLMDEQSEPMRGFATGTSFHVAVPSGISSVDVTLPDKSVLRGLPVYDNAVTIYGAQAGFYEVVPNVDVARSLEFAANFVNPDESNLARPVAEIHGRDYLKTTLDEIPEEADETWLVRLLSGLPASSQYLWVLALLIALGLISVEWLTYHRRWTV